MKTIEVSRIRPACLSKDGARAHAISSARATRVERKSGRAGAGTRTQAISNRPEKFASSDFASLVDLASADIPETHHLQEQVISEDTLCKLEIGVLDSGEGMKALRRFNDALDSLAWREDWESALEPVWAEMAYNLESFNPVFTACMLKVQCTLGSSDYVARDACLQSLIQPLAGEYGLHENEKLDKTHRELFSDFYTSVTGRPLSHILGKSSTTLKPRAGQLLFAQMMKDIGSGGGVFDGPLHQASYALGYNLAVEYLANPEKTWLLDSFQRLSNAMLEGKAKVDWKFLEVHALGEKEHAEIGHRAVSVFVPQAHARIVQRAMEDHDRDFAAYYNQLARLIEETA